MDIKSIKPRLKVFLEFTIENSICLGKVIIELFEDSTPLTCYNFLRMIKKSNNALQRYIGSSIFKIKRGYYLQMGDITHENGLGGISSFGSKFREENFYHQFNDSYRVAMTNTGMGSTQSQFFITLCSAPWLNNNFVVFGRVVDGFNILDKISLMDVDEFGEPKTAIIVSDSGIYKDKREDEGIQETNDNESFKSVIEEEELLNS